MTAPNISTQQIEKAALALGAFHQKQSKNSLLNEDAIVFTAITLNRIPEKHIKPILIPIPHPIYSSQRTSICLIVKDSVAKTKIKQVLESHSTKFSIKVITIESLRLKFKPYEAKRLLKKSYSLFISDDRLLPSLPKLLGAKFFQAKKLPIAISLNLPAHVSKLPETILSILNSTMYTIPSGTALTVRTALISHTPLQIAENVHAIVNYLTVPPKDAISNESVAEEETKDIESKEGKVSNNGNKKKKQKQMKAQRRQGGFKMLLQAVSLKLVDSATLPVWAEFPEVPKETKKNSDADNGLSSEKTPKTQTDEAHDKAVEKTIELKISRKRKLLGTPVEDIEVKTSATEKKDRKRSKKLKQ